MNNQHYDLSLPYLRAFIGLVLIFLSLYASIGFLSQGFEGLAFIAIVVFCICIEAVKVLFAGDIGFYLAIKQPEKAIAAALILLILFCLSIGAEAWFLGNGGLKENAQLETSTAQLNSLQNQISAKQAQLAQCNPSHLTKCVNPRTAELAALQTELDKLQLNQSSQSAVIANQKFWQQIAKATNTTPENLQLGLDLLRAILQEVIGLFLLSQYSTFKRFQAFKEKGSFIAEKVINQNNEQALIENQALLKQIEHLKSELQKKD